MNAIVIVISNKPIYFSKSFLISFKAIPLVTFPFQNTVKGFDEGILVWRLVWNALMLNASLLAEGVEGFADELRAVIGSKNRMIPLPVCRAFQECFLDDS